MVVITILNNIIICIVNDKNIRDSNDKSNKIVSKSKEVNIKESDFGKAFKKKINWTVIIPVGIFCSDNNIKYNLQLLEKLIKEKDILLKRREETLKIKKISKDEVISNKI